jgi:uncharacterized LabA/DUF88 family protein
MPKRLALFIDAQNTYMCAREAFFSPGAYPNIGQFDPIALGRLIADRDRGDGGRELSEVRVYTGRPASNRNPRGYGANRRQAEAWAKRGAKVYVRILRYDSAGRGQEKGIDVQLAVDFVAGAIEAQWDVGVVFSTDTDLVPALEYVATKFRQQDRVVEVAAWSGGNRALRLQGGRSAWCHYLSRADFDTVADPTIYVERADRRDRPGGASPGS